MKGVCIGKLVVDPVEHIFFVPFIMHHYEFRAVEESSCIQSIRCDEISPLWTAVCEIEASIY